MIDPEALVLIDLDPVLTLDTTLAATIPTRVEAEMAVQGWSIADMTDKRSVYIGLLVTRSFVSRLLLKFAQEIKKTEGGAAKVEFADAIKYLEALREELDGRKIDLASIGDASLAVTNDRWPSGGALAW